MNLAFETAKKRREIIFNFIAKSSYKSRTVREIIDYCTNKEAFKYSYVPEAVKQNYLILIRKKLLIRKGNSLLINKPND